MSEVFYDLVDDESITFIQTITIKDDQAPVVTADDFEVQITSGCTVSFELPEVVIEDGCSTDTYDITLNDADLGSYGSGGTYFGVPEGVYNVTYTVADPCGNVGTAIRTVIVLEKAPTAFCTDELVIDLSSDGEAQVSAVDFNVGSSDNCTPAENLEYSFTSNLSDDNFPSLTKSNNGFPETFVNLGNGTIVSPWPPITIASISFTGTLSSSDKKSLNLELSNIPAIPTTLFVGSPEYF